MNHKKQSKIIWIIKKIYLPLLAIFFGLLYLLVHFKEQFIGLEHFDEGFRLYTASLILDGKVPYRDFYVLYPPGYLYFLAFLFKTFGTNIIVARIGTLFVQSFSVSLAFILSSLTGSIYFGVITAISLIIFHTDIQLGVVPLIFIESLCISFYLRNYNKNFIFIAGLFCGIMSFFRIDFSVYSFIISILVIIIIELHKGLENFRIFRFSKLITLFKLTLPFYIGFILGIIPLLIYLLKVGIYNSWQYLVVYTHQISIARRLPFPVFLPNYFNYIQSFPNIPTEELSKSLINSWPFYFIFVVPLVSIFDLIIRKKLLIKSPNSFFMRVLFSISIFIYSLYFLYRPDIEHTWTIYFFIFILIPSFFDGIYHLINNSFLLKYFVLSILVLLFPLFWSQYYIDLLSTYFLLLIPIVVVYHVMSNKRDILSKNIPCLIFFLFISNFILLDHLRTYRSSQFYPQDTKLLEIPRAGGVMISKKAEGDYENLVKYISNKTKAGDVIFSGSTRHDKIFINDTMLYFLTGAKAATKYWQFEPMYKNQQHQMDIINDLDRTRPNYIVLWALASISNESNESSISSGVFLLDNYIKERYEPIKKFGNYIVLQRKDNFK